MHWHNYVKPPQRRKLLIVLSPGKKWPSVTSYFFAALILPTYLNFELRTVTVGSIEAKVNENLHLYYTRKVRTGGERKVEAEVEQVKGREDGLGGGYWKG